MGTRLQRYRDGWLLLLLAVAFATLASTGRLGWVVLLLAGAAYGLRGALFAAGRSVQLPSKWLLLGLLLYLPVYAADALLWSSGFLDATLHLVVLAGAAKIFCLPGARDRLGLATLALLEVMAAALVTVSGVFFVLFLIFLVVLVAALVAQEMARAEANSAPATAAPAPAQPRIPLLRFSLALSAAVATGSVLIFFLLPRTAWGDWGGHRAARGLSGFSDEVQLGAIASLQRSDNPVMHIRVLQADPPLSPEQIENLAWRGRGLGSFDGRRWFNSDPPALYATQAGRLDVNPLWLNRPTELLRYQVTLEPIASPVLFFPSQLLRASTHLPVLAWDRRTATLTSAAADNSSFSGAAYSGVSNLTEPPASELIGAPPPSRRDMRFGLDEFLQLPPGLDPRIGELAHSIVAHVPGDNWDRMQALADYLRTHYQYTVEALPQGEDPLATFLFDQPQGDCEYFASALAVMGRVLNIPTRVVNGFLGGTYNSLSGEYVVRGRDAHSWVEAYFPATSSGERERGWRFRRESGSWVRFDATPAENPAGADAGAGMVLDALSSFWQEWIVNYDRLQQAGLARQLEASLSGAADLAQRGDNAAASAWQTLSQPQSWSRADLAWGLGFAVLIACGLAGGWGLWRGRWRLRWRDWSWPRPDQAAGARRAATLSYRRFQRSLERLGLRRAPGQTAPELREILLRQHRDPNLSQSVAAYVAAYEALRFGPVPADLTNREAELASALAQVQRQVRTLHPLT